MESFLAPRFADRLREINQDTWIIQGSVLIERRYFELSKPDSKCWYDPIEAVFYGVSTFPKPLKWTQLPAAGCPVKLFLDLGNCSARWKIGSQAFLEIGSSQPEILCDPVPYEKIQKQPWSFSIPEVYFHTERDGVYCTVHSVIGDGTTLKDVWDSGDDAWRERVTSRIAHAILEMSAWRGDYTPSWPALPPTEYLNAKGLSDDSFHSHLNEAQYDPGRIIFSHNSPALTNIWMSEQGDLGFYGWQTAGFVPADWVRTKRALVGYAFGSADWAPDLPPASYDWFKKLDVKLSARGLNYDMNLWSWNCQRNPGEFAMMQQMAEGMEGRLDPFHVFPPSHPVVHYQWLAWPPRRQI
jgi:hypothetical protein